MSTNLICTVTTGPPLTVVRWYLDPADAGRPEIEPAVSACQYGVRVGAYLHLVPPYVLDSAAEAYAALKDDPGYDLSVLATHRRDGDGPLVKILQDGARA